MKTERNRKMSLRKTRVVQSAMRRKALGTS
jgi:hypothetical protein